MAKRILIQFWIKYRGYVGVDVVPMPYDKPETLARSAVTVALERFNKRWPGARGGELHVTGMTDGSRTINASGGPAPLVSPDLVANP